jgi:hypothetical protein
VGTQLDICDLLYWTELDSRTSYIGLKMDQCDIMADIELNFVLIFDIRRVLVHEGLWRNLGSQNRNCQNRTVRTKQPGQDWTARTDRSEQIAQEPIAGPPGRDVRTRQ